MTTESHTLDGAVEPVTRWRDRVRAWSGSVAYVRTTDILILLAVASLPWSTTALAVFMLLWLVAVIPTIDWEQFILDLAQPAFALPVALVTLAVLGMAWSEAGCSPSCSCRR